jgi:peptide deformylase
MAMLEIRKYDDPVLKKKCEEVKQFDKALKKLVLDMAEIMEKNQGVGLAAPQVGVLKRIVVINNILTGGDSFVFINPKIVKYGKKKEFFEEGCLSFPGLFLKIKRPEAVEVESTGLDGEKSKIKAEGMLARVLQHEIDHLNGVLFFNRLSVYQKLKIKLGDKKAE